MAADKFCAAMHNDIDAVFEWPEQYRRSNGIVANHRQTIFMGDFGDFLIIQNIVFGIADGFDINQPGIFLNRFCEIFRFLGSTNVTSIPSF